MQKNILVIAAGGVLTWGVVALVKPFLGVFSLVASASFFISYLFLTGQIRWDELLKLVRRQPVEG